MTFKRLASAPLAAPLALSLLCAALIGCGAGPASHSSSGSMVLNGTVYGGQNPVSNSAIQLYVAGTTGNHSPAHPLISSGSYYPGGAPNCVPSSSQTCNSGVYSDANGDFTITGDYTCINNTDQVYLVATGGNPGLTPAVNNQALVMMAVLGNCGTLFANAATTNIFVDEVTTVAAAWALAPFMTSATTVGASSTNTLGLDNAFKDAGLLANTSNGMAATLLSTQTIETGKLYALADAIAPCVNSDGTTACGALFSAATVGSGARPTNVLNAALNIVQNPSNNVTPVFKCILGQPPFATTLQNPPNDWTMSLTLTGNGLSEPTQIGIDYASNVWVADYPGNISGFTAQGAPLAVSPLGTGIISEVYGFTVDSNNNLWAANEQEPAGSGSLTGFYGVTSGQTLGSIIPNTGSSTPNYFYDSSIAYPEALAADSSGNVYIANYDGGDVTIYNEGTPVQEGVGYGYTVNPAAIAPDTTGGFWVANSTDYTVGHVTAAGRPISHPTCCNRANGIGTDSTGNAWVGDYGSSSISEVSPACDSTGVAGNGACTSASNVVLLNQVGSLSYPGKLHLDAAQNIWLVNVYNTAAGPGGFSLVIGNGQSQAAGTVISPVSGYGHDAVLTQPFDIVPDASGNLWVSNFGQNSLVMFFGLATPTANPARPVPTAP